MQFAAAFMEMFSYGNAIAEDRRANPRDDLVSVIANAEVEGERLSQVEFNMFWLLLVIAGNETTRNLLSGGTLALIEHPEQLERVVADRALLPTAIEEMLRFVSPVIHFRRTATEETEVAGQSTAWVPTWPGRRSAPCSASCSTGYPDWSWPARSSACSRRSSTASSTSPSRCVSDAQVCWAVSAGTGRRSRLPTPLTLGGRPSRRGWSPHPPPRARRGGSPPRR